MVEDSLFEKALDQTHHENVPQEDHRRPGNHVEFQDTLRQRRIRLALLMIVTVRDLHESHLAA